MNDFTKLLSALDSDAFITDTDEHAKIFFHYLADQVDNHIQTALFYELMDRYAHISKHLEDLVQEKVKEISASQIATIHALVKAAEARDDDTGAHIERTSKYCRILAEKVEEAGAYAETVDTYYADNIAMASPLHDIGKIGIPDAVLLKPGRLTWDEFEIMKSHPVIGYETLASVESLYPENTFLKFGMEISRYHHEKWDGSGYGNGLSGEDIPLSARIMALADVYDALRSKRVYKEPFSHERTIAIILEGRGNHFDPALVDVFVEHQLLFRDIYDSLSVK